MCAPGTRIGFLATKWLSAKQFENWRVYNEPITNILQEIGQHIQPGGSSGSNILPSQTHIQPGGSSGGSIHYIKPGGSSEALSCLVSPISSLEEAVEALSIISSQEKAVEAISFIVSPIYSPQEAVEALTIICSQEEAVEALSIISSQEEAGEAHYPSYSVGRKQWRLNCLILSFLILINLFSLPLL